MGRIATIALAAFFITGCSHREATRINTSTDQIASTSFTSGNALGNYLELPESARVQGVSSQSRDGQIATADQQEETASPTMGNIPIMEEAPDVTPPIADAGETFAEGELESESPFELDDVNLSDAIQREQELEEELETIPDEVASHLEDEFEDTTIAAVEIVESTTESETTAVELADQTSSELVTAPEATTTLPSSPRLSTEQIAAAVEDLRGLSGWTVIPFAHFRRGARHAVIAWPALNPSGRPVDATVVGICLEEDGEGGVEECGQRWVVSDVSTSTAALERALGGDDYELVGRTIGAPLEDLGPFLSRMGSEFVSAVARGDRSGARRAAMAFTTMLPLERVAFDNDVAQLLLLGARYNGSLQHVGTVGEGDIATLTFHVQRGFFRVQTIRATARQIEGEPDSWYVVAYQ